MAEPRSPRRISALLQHPLVQFLLIGAVLFALYNALNPTKDILSRRIRVDDGEIRWLADTFENQFGHRPSKTELQTLVGNYVDDEMKVREALAMGLDRDDSVVRRRLIQKYDFIEAPDVPLPPSDTVLKAWYDKHPESYVAPPSIDFCQVYVAPEPDRATAIARSHAVTSQLISGAHPIGDPLDVEPCEKGVGADAVAREYGVNFAKALGSVPVALWAGPVESGFGFHSVKVTSRGTPSRMLFAEAKSDVLSDWQRAAQLAARKKQLDVLHQRYSSSIDQAALDRAVKAAPRQTQFSRHDDPLPEMGGDEGGGD